MTQLGSHRLEEPYMPIPAEEINRLIIPRVLTPTTTLAELLYLFAEQPNPRRCYAVVRVGTAGYDVLALDDLSQAFGAGDRSLLGLPLSRLTGLLRAVAPVRQNKVGKSRAQQLQSASPRRRLVVLDAN